MSLRVDGHTGGTAWTTDARLASVAGASVRRAVFRPEEAGTLTGPELRVTCCGLTAPWGGSSRTRARRSPVCPRPVP